MDPTHYLHTAIVVSDLPQSEAFYGTILGLPKVDRVLRFPGAWYQLGSVQIHLIQQDDFAVPSQAEKLGRNAHLALAVADLEVAKAELIAQGCVVQASASGRAALFTQDPDGNVIELQELEASPEP